MHYNSMRRMKLSLQNIKFTIIKKFDKSTFPTIEKNVKLIWFIKISISNEEIIYFLNGCIVQIDYHSHESKFRIVFSFWISLALNTNAMYGVTKHHTSYITRGSGSVCKCTRVEFLAHMHCTFQEWKKNECLSFFVSVLKIVYGFFCPCPWYCSNF